MYRLFSVQLWVSLSESAQRKAKSKTEVTRCLNSEHLAYENENFEMTRAIAYCTAGLPTYPFHILNTPPQPEAVCHRLIGSLV